MYLSKNAFIATGVLVVLGLSFLIAFFEGSFFVILGGLMATLGLLVYLKNNHLGMILMVLSIVAGNLVRFSLGANTRGGAAVLILDVLVGLLVFSWLIKKIIKYRDFKKAELSSPIIIFLMIALLSWINGLYIMKYTGELEFKESLISFLYWARYACYAGIYFVSVDLIDTKEKIKKYVDLILGMAVLVSVGGFIQLKIMPDFTAYAVQYGWDPHQDRLLSTFFDPNFLGAFLAMIIVLALSLFLYEKETKRKIWYLIVMLICGLALVLTYSRTGYLALLFAGFIVAISKSKKLLFVGVVCFVLILSLSPRTFTRITEGLSVDATGMKRIESWVKGVKLVPAYPVLGTGYNNFASVQDDLALVDEFDVNNRGGVENSLLTILVTTGFLGLVSFISIYIILIKKLYYNWKYKIKDEYLLGLNLGVMVAIIALLVSSITINSLLYSFILVVFWMMAGMIEYSAD